MRKYLYDYNLKPFLSLHFGHFSYLCLQGLILKQEFSFRDRGKQNTEMDTKETEIITQAAGQWSILKGPQLHHILRWRRRIRAHVAVWE